MFQPNSPLPEHLKDVPTPALVVIASRFQANLEKMAGHCERKGISLRPHAKTHKSSAIAKAQIRLGAVGICCATLSEAELLADEVDNILITSPVIGKANLKRLKSLHGRVGELTCVIDDPSSVPSHEELFTAAQPLNVLLDLDPGMHRTGAAMDNATADFVRTLCESAEFRFSGIQCYAGNLMHVANRQTRKELVGAVWDRVAAFKELLVHQGLPCATVSGGGTGRF